MADLLTSDEIVSRETIFALSSGAGKSGVAVIRIAGHEAKKLFGHLISGKCPYPASIAYREIIDFTDGEKLDRALILYFEGPKSFTGTDVVEIHCHGSVAIISRILSLLASIDNFKAAQAGEFTRLAFDNGKMDLTQVEGLSDLIASETEAQRKLALRLASGHLSQSCEKWRAHLLRAAAMITAVIDFADEDVPDEAAQQGLKPLDSLITDIQKELSNSENNQIILNGFEVVILGEPNVGKSSLLNALAGQDVAITSPVAGTTRDMVQIKLDISGIAVTITDTAGLRDSDDDIEQEGVKRALKRASMSNAQIIMHAPEFTFKNDFPDFEGPRLFILNKSDTTIKDIEGFISISAKKAQNINLVTDWLESCVKDLATGTSGSIARQRQRDDLQKALKNLLQARDYLSDDHPELELVSVYLENAMRNLQSLLGYSDVEELLGAVFAEFCVGK